MNITTGNFIFKELDQTTFFVNKNTVMWILTETINQTLSLLYNIQSSFLVTRERKTPLLQCIRAGFVIHVRGVYRYTLKQIFGRLLPG